MLKSTARRLYHRLPRGAQRRLRAALGPTMRRRRTRGLAVDSVAVSWAQATRLPVSIVIPSFNDLPLLRACLASIELTCSDLDYEVIVVDDYCQEPNREALRRLVSGRVRVIFRAERGGFAKAVNTGIAQARYDVVLLNSDIVASPGWLATLQHAAYEIDPRIGMVSPLLMYPDGLVQYGGTYHARTYAPQWWAHMWVGRPANDPLANVPWFTRGVSGACVYVKREVIDAIGGLDERYWLGFEDVDWAMQAWRAGFRCWYEPSARLIHHESATRGYSQGKRELASMRHFWRQWPTESIRIADRDEPLHVVVSAASTPLWRAYVAQLAARCAAQGLTVVTHDHGRAQIDEAIVADLAGRRCVVVAADVGAMATTWLATERSGIAVAMLDSVGREPAEIAALRPEFDYVVPSSAAAEALPRLCSWPAVAVAPPVLIADGAPDSSEEGRDGPVVTFGLDLDARRALDRVAASRSRAIVHIDALDDGTFDEISALRPRAIVDRLPVDSPLRPLSLSSIGAAYIGSSSPETRMDVLDGQTALLPSDAASLVSRLEDVLDDDDVWRELRQNAHEAAVRRGELAADAILALVRRYQALGR